MDMQATIDAAKARLGNVRMSDATLAAQLGVATSTFARDKRLGFSDPVALRLAELADADPVIVLATVRAMRERDPKVKSVLERLAERVAGTVGAMILATTMHVGDSHALDGGRGR